jgi:16S rRNA A1518/A1519 N6-dimethyltransferase RsmA/KsgA/DIM1 with predicted DNA glycosylase/AP lyase activity
MNTFLFISCESLIFIFVLSYIFIPIFGPPFVPSKKKAVSKMIELAKPGKNDLLLDIGSGDGRIVLALAKQGFKIHGIEINPFFVLWSNFLLLLNGQWKNARVFWANFNHYNFSKYNIIFCYLFPGTLEKLAPKFAAQLQPNTKIVSNTFLIKGWKEVDHSDKIYLYKIV